MLPYATCSMQYAQVCIGVHHAAVIRGGSAATCAVCGEHPSAIWLLSQHAFDWSTHGIPSEALDFSCKYCTMHMM
jgi:hypothetical protein